MLPERLIDAYLANGDGKSSAVATSHGKHLDTNGKSGKNDEELSRERLQLDSMAWMRRDLLA